MKTNRPQWLATTARYLGLGMALSSWSSRPPTPHEIQEITTRLRELFSHKRSERSAALGAPCCSPTVILCCPTVALA
jgi:hypothetical protein